jgi:hypothetical protein
MTRRFTNIAAILITAALSQGCGAKSDGDSSSTSSSAPVDGMILRRTGVAEGTVAWAGWWTVDAMLGVISDGDVTTHHSTSVSSGFSFPTTGDVAFDLDALSGGTTDLYPTASGTISVHYTGTSVPSAPSGSGGVGQWTLTATTTSVVTRTDTLSGGTVTIPSGTVIAEVALEVSCNRVDASHWTMSCDCRMPAGSGEMDLTLDEADSSGSSTARVRGYRTFSYSSDMSGSTIAIHGWPSENHWTCDIADGSGTHQVVFGNFQPTGCMVDGVNVATAQLALAIAARIDAEGTVHNVTSP